MGIDAFIARQLRRPSGLVGRLMVGKSLNKSNGSLEDMGLEWMKIQSSDSILEIGFGNGRLISKMAEIIEEGTIMGIDISKVMISQARRKNRDHINLGRVKLIKASVVAIPSEDETFDKIFTANTIYFWPSPEANIREVWRTLKRGGRFYCALRLREDMVRIKVVQSNRHIFRNLFSRDEIVDLFEKSGFVDVQLIEERRPHYSEVIVSGRKA